MRFLSFTIRLLPFFFLIAGSVSGSTPDDQKCHRSTEGTEFWFGFMEGRNDNNNVHYIEITVTAREATNFKVFIGGIEFLTPGFVNANSSIQIKLPLATAEAKGSEQVENKGIYLVAENPVNVYALNWDRNSADLAVIYPVESLGKEYFAMCYTPFVDDDPDHGRNSEFLVVAANDSTRVEIIPSVVTDQGKPAGVPFSIILNKGEVYQVQSLNRRNLAGQGDLTGSSIKSDKPVAVYSGNFSVVIPAQNNVGGFDHLFEQMPPVQTWGREYYAVPLLTRRSDLYRIIASEDSTSVQIGNRPRHVINSGEWFEFALQSYEPSRIFADKPVMVAQFSQSNSTDSNGDPFMIILSSVSQSKNDVTFVAYNSNQIRNYYVNVVTPTSEINNILLDGIPISNQFRQFAGTNYSYAQITTSLGTHQLQNIDEDRGFLAYVYGYGGYESYGYGVGFNLDLILDIGQNIDFQGDTLPMCKGSQVLLDAGPYFDEYLWNTGDTTQKIIVTTEGKYWAIGRTIDGCERKDSIYVILAGKVKPDIGTDESGCAPYSKILDPGTGFRTYEWNTGDLTQSINVDRTGEYILTVTDRFWCATRDTMNFTVFPVPEIKMKSSPIVCGTKNHVIELQFSGIDESAVNRGKMVWSNGQPSKLTFNNHTNSTAGIQVTEWGEYDVSFKFKTADSCEVSGILNLKFAETPTAEFSFADDSNDKCKGYNREVFYTGNATQNAHYYWDFGNCLADSVNWNRWRVSLSPGNSKAKVSLFVEENGCFSPDTLKMDIGANPDFVMNTTKSRGCDSALVNFSGELKVTDNVEFEWNFGDGSAISTQQNPSHFYSKTGFYDVSLKITNTDNGCFIGFTETEMVKIFPTPVAEFTIDPASCADSIVQAVYSFNIDSSFCSWTFTGAHQVGTGNDSVFVFLDHPTGIIRLQVDEFGCKSAWTEKPATRKPFFDIETDTDEGCQPFTVKTMAVSEDESLVYTWITDSVIVTGSENYYTIDQPGKFGFRLAAYSENTGCSDTIFNPGLVTVNQKPEAKFEIDYPVAIIDNASLTFTNLTNDVSSFNWDFGDGSVSQQENPVHQYTAVGKYPVSLITGTEKGCLDTTFSFVEIVPFTTYTPNAFRPDSEIAENRLFMPVTVGVDPGNFSLLIFNRWGEVVFESDSPDYKWDGTAKNNQPAPVGNYIWKAEFLDVQGFSHSIKGQVLLIR